MPDARPWTAGEWQLIYEAADLFEAAQEDLTSLTRLVRQGNLVGAAPLMKELTDKLKVGGSNVSLAHRSRYLEE